MQVRWTAAAAEDLENIANYLFNNAPEHAARLTRELYKSALLETFQSEDALARKAARAN